MTMLGAPSFAPWCEGWGTDTDPSVQSPTLAVQGWGTNSAYSAPTAKLVLDRATRGMHEVSYAR